jgi:large subunit ribosomal protein L35
MPKLKTRRSTAKRLRLTGTGRIRRAHAYRSHLLTNRSRKRKRQLRKPDLISQADQERMKRLLPYG